MYVRLERRLRRDTTALLASVKDMLALEIDQHVELMSAVLMALEQNADLQAAWLTRDREQLLALVSSMFEEYRAKHHITHFYFHGEDRINFLRVHNPDKHGDLIDRRTLIQAAQTGQQAGGLELGPLGTLTLRVARPWRIEGRLVGYLELGEEIGVIIQEMHGLLGCELAVTIDKQYVTRQEWEAGMQLLGRQPNWDKLPNRVICDRTLAGIDHVPGGPGVEVTDGGRSYRTGCIELTDTAGRNVGHLAVLQDITAERAGLRRSLAIAAAAGLSPLLGLFGLLYVLLGRIQGDLRAKEAKLRTITDSALDAVVMIDPDGKAVHWNPSAERMFGYSPQEMLGRPIHDTLCPARYRAAAQEGIDAFATTGRGRAVGRVLELHAMRKNGEEFPIEIAIAPIRFADRWGAVATIRDITDRKRAEEALRANETKYRTLVEHLPQRIFYKDRNSVYVSCNELYAQDLGIPAAEIAGKTDFDFYPPELVEKYRADDRRIMELGRTEEIEEEYVDHGRRRTVATVKLPIRDEQGEVAGVLGIFSDITERKRAEEALRRVHADTEQVLASIPSILISVGEDDRITKWNRAAEEVFGLSSDQAVGRPLGESGIQWDWAGVAAGIWKSRAEGRSIRIDEIPFRRPDGKEGFLGFTISPIEGGDAQDGPRGVLLVGADVTERKILQHQLTQAQKLESIGQLAAGIAHEISTPTQFVGDNTRFLQDAFGGVEKLLAKYAELYEACRVGRASDDLLAEVDAAVKEADLDYVREEVPKAISQSLDGVNRVATIVRAMKDFSHPSSEEKKAIDLNKAIESTITVARNEWKYVAETAMDFDPALPPVPCLAGEFNQVILNLIINAAHAIGDVVKNGASDKGTITISTRRDGEWVEIRVRDTGTGIPEHLRTRIFEPFFTTKQVGRGTGQGLNMAHAVVVKRHGGTITFETEVGQGTTFIIRLPIMAESPQEPEAERYEEAYSVC